METLFLLGMFVTQAWTPGVAPQAASLGPPQNAPVAVRMVDGTDLKNQPQARPRVRGVPAPQRNQAQSAPAQPQAQAAPQTRYYYPYPVIVNVYSQPAPAPEPQPDYEYAYYNPIAPVYYVSWPEYMYRGNFYPWGVYRPYPNPPYGVCHYRYPGSAAYLSAFYRQSRTNIFYNQLTPCHSIR